MAVGVKPRKGTKGSKVGHKVGFYGCNNRVVRLEVIGRVPQHVDLECPACSHEHRATPYWRPYKASIDAGKDSVMVYV